MSTRTMSCVGSEGHVDNMDRSPPPPFYNVTFQFHEVHLKHAMEEAYLHREFGDLVIVAGGVKIKAHKFVMSALSTSFRNSISEQDLFSCNHIIFAVNTTEEIMSLLLRFVYTGQVDVPNELLDSVIALGEELGISGLCKQSNPKVIAAVEALFGLHYSEGTPAHSAPYVPQTVPADYSKHRPDENVVTAEPAPPFSENNMESLKARQSTISPPTYLEDNFEGRHMTNGFPVTDLHNYCIKDEEQSSDSDGELHIDMENGHGTNIHSYACESGNEDDSEPQDLRIESRQCLSNGSCTSICSPDTNAHSPSPSYVETKVIHDAHPAHFLATEVEVSDEQLSVPSSSQNSRLSNHIPGVSKNSHTIKKKSTCANNKKDRSSEKTYSGEDLRLALNLAIHQKMSPQQVLLVHKIPRRTFFRHLKTEKQRLGLPTRTKRSRPSSPQPSVSGISTKSEVVVSGQSNNLCNSVTTSSSSLAVPSSNLSMVAASRVISSSRPTSTRPISLSALSAVSIGYPQTIRSTANGVPNNVRLVIQKNVHSCGDTKSQRIPELLRLNSNGVKKEVTLTDIQAV